MGYVANYNLLISRPLFCNERNSCLFALSQYCNPISDPKHGSFPQVILERIRKTSVSYDTMP